MAGIIFIKTKKIEEITKFYKELGATIWIQQPDVNILRHGNMLFGFHQHNELSKDVLLTFFYPDKHSVNEKYHELQHLAKGPPKEDKKYQIYNFFAKDPENRTIEFQYFLDKINFNWNCE